MYAHTCNGYIQIYTNMCIYTYMSICVSVSPYTHMYICIHTHIMTCIFV